MVLSGEFFLFDLSPVVGLINFSGLNLYCNNGLGLLLSGGTGNGPVGAGFCGGSASGLATLSRCRFEDGLTILRLGDPESIDVVSTVSFSEYPVVVAKDDVAEMADVGIVPSSLSSPDRSKRSLIQDPLDVSDVLFELRRPASLLSPARIVLPETAERVGEVNADRGDEGGA
jgi:hypothetical protein